MLPEEFVRSLSELLPGVEAATLAAALETEAEVSVRFNPYKLSSPPEGEQVPWCRYGFYAGERKPSFTLDPLHHAGVYYVQEASSMFVEHIVRELYDDPAGLRMLDLCAAPGGKTTLLATLAGLEGLVVANEVVSHRAAILAGNVARWGLGNTLVTANDPSHFNTVKDFFDLVLVDAPCSGEGMFRKNPASRGLWSPAAVATCAARQRSILAEIWNSLRPGGVLIYSTCTFNRAENEDNARWLIDNYDAEAVPVGCPPEWDVTGGIDQDIPSYRFFPHKTRGEGFTAIVIRKGEGKPRPKLKSTRRTLLRELTGRPARHAAGWVAQGNFMKFAAIGEEVYGYYRSSYEDTVRLSESLNVIYSGVHMGRMIKDKLVPSHNLALFHDLNNPDIPTVDLPLEPALEYLRRGDVAATYFTEGLNLVTHNGYPVGWVKRIGNRINNLYPKELRIQHL